MQLQIFDVSHGFCAYLIADNRNTMLFDCGHNDRTGFRPSSYLVATGCSGIEHLIIQNFDQDHISDLPNVLARLPVKRFFRNQSIAPEQLRALKMQAGPLTSAMEATIGIHGDYIHEVENPPQFNLEFETFYNLYPTFTDTNNLSVVSFVHCDGLSIVFAGDLEKAGWQALLKNTSFCAHLRRVNIFVASHHGRVSGYCEEVFNYCTPDIVIISDKEITYETQKHNYRKHATGLPWNGAPDRRHVLTTRSDGTITITKALGTAYHVAIGSTPAVRW